MRRYPETQACVVVLANDDDAPLQAMAQAIEEVLFGDPPTTKELPQPVPAALAQAVVGTFDDSGNKLVVEERAGVMRATIHWARGPVTRAVLGVDASGDLVLYEWTAVTKVKVDREGRKPARVLSLAGGGRYRRQ
jgi:hypothetical protein